MSPRASSRRTLVATRGVRFLRLDWELRFVSVRNNLIINMELKFVSAIFQVIY